MMATKHDAFEYKRAQEAREWLKRPERKVEDAADRKRRIAADRRAGHLPQCGLMKCHPDYPSLKEPK